MKNSIKILLVLFFVLFVFASCENVIKTSEETDRMNENSEDNNQTTSVEKEKATESEKEIQTQREIIDSVLYKDDFNLLIANENNFEDVKSVGETNWEAFGGGQAMISSDVSHSGTNSFRVFSRENEWTTPAFDLFPCISENGAGFYKLSLYYKMEGNIKDGDVINFGTCIRSNGEADKNSFITDNSGIFYARLDNASFTYKSGEWYLLERIIYIEEDDITGTHSWLFCFDMLTVGAEAIYVDDCILKKEEVDMKTETYIPESVMTWVANEIVLIAQNSYSSPFYDVEVNAEFTCGDKIINVPAFWDGSDIWRVRFALPEAGDWTYIITSKSSSETVSVEDSGLSGSGKIKCTLYDGSLDIYKHGFIKTEPQKRYFMYNDCTPFFYLGDTHWNMPNEEFDTAGEHAGQTGAQSHFKYIVDTRVSQGFTVYQSEPIGTTYNLANGFSEADIIGFRELDKKFAYIANAGLVHANAELFFSSELYNNNASYPDEYLEKLTRYWVARYGAYPVMWTLAQECDDDFYFDRGDQKIFDAQNNPWKKVLAYIYKYDPYNSPMTAHMEYASMDKTGGVNASRSAFGSQEGHTWYGVQWSPKLDGQLDFALPRDFILNGGGKPAINYEGRYDYLWTKHFGARVQGWTAYLNGMMGYGYGAIDIWLYLSSYNTDVSSNDGVDNISTSDKAVIWGESVNFETAWQMGYMKNFFQKYEWFNLCPRFDDSDWIKPLGGTCYSLATIDDELFVLYLYNRNSSGAVLYGLDVDSDYKFSFFNPRTAEFSDEKIIRSENGSYEISQKPDRDDWVCLLEKIH